MREGWERVALGEMMVRTAERLGSAPEPTILTCTENHGLVDQMDHMGRRLATEDVSKYKLVEPFDIVYNVYLLWLGSIGQNLTGATGITSPVYEVFRPTAKAHPPFLGLLLRSPEMVERYGAISIGTVPRRRRAPWETLLDLEVDVPPLLEQQRIVDLISALEEAIESADESATTTASTLRAITSALLTRPDPSSTDTQVGEIAMLAGGHAFPTALQGKTSGKFPLYKVSDMNRHGNEVVMTESANWLDESDREAMRFRTWPAGTVVFPKVGAALHTEKRRVLGVEGAFDNNVMGASPGDSILPGYLLAYLETVRLGELAQPGAVPSINQGHVASLSISLPSLDVQRERVEAIDAARAAANESSTLATSLRALRSNLLTALLSGEHQIPATYDALLEGAA